MCYSVQNGDSPGPHLYIAQPQAAFEFGRRADNSTITNGGDLQPFNIQAMNYIFDTMRRRPFLAPLHPQKSELRDKVKAGRRATANTSPLVSHSDPHAGSNIDFTDRKFQTSKFPAAFRSFISPFTPSLRLAFSSSSHIKYTVRTKHAGNCTDFCLLSPFINLVASEGLCYFWFLASLKDFSLVRIEVSVGSSSVVHLKRQEISEKKKKWGKTRPSRSTL